MTRPRLPRLDPTTASAAILLAASALGASTLPGCGGTSSTTRGGGDARAAAGKITADERFEAGDWDGAVAAYRRELAQRPGDAALVEKLATATRLAANAHAEAAVRRSRAGDPIGAGIELERAESLDAESPIVRRAREMLGDRVAAGRKASDLREAGRGLVESEPERAVEILAEARRLAPFDEEVIRLLRDATLHAEATRAAARAAESWNAGARAQALDDLRSATVGGKPVAAAETLRKRIETDLLAESAASDLEAARVAWRLASEASVSSSATVHLRTRFVDLLLSRATAAAAEGRTALAALLETEALRAGARTGTPNADRVREEAAPRVHVLPFEDGTGGSVDGARLAQALRDRIVADAAGGSAPLFADTEPPPEGPGGDAWPHVVVDGRVLSSRAGTGKSGTETVHVRYVVGQRDVENPEASALAVETDRVRARLDAAEESLRSAETRLRKIKELPFIQNPGGTVVREGDVTYQTQLANAEAGVEDAKRKRDAVKTEEFALRQRIAATPGLVGEPVYAEHPLPVTTRTKTFQMAARLKVVAGGETLLDDPVSASAEHRETVAPAFPEGGVAEDPDETPDDAEMASRAAGQFAAVVGGKVRAAVEQGALRLLRDAREKEKAGDFAGAVEGYATYLLVTPETATPERAAAARALLERAGLRTSLRTGLPAEAGRR